MTARFTVQRLGAGGDGVAETASGPVHIPFTLPAETVSAMRQGARARLTGVITPSPDRVDPPCRHFGTCGGCALQHMNDASYRAWKRTRVVDALRRRRINVPVGDLVACPPGSRRRLALGARHTQGGMILGYRTAMSHRIIDIGECPIALPELVAALPMLRELARLACSTCEPFRVEVTATLAGLDVAVSGAGRLSNEARIAVVDFAIANRICRLSLDGEVIVETDRPVVMFGPVAVRLAPGGFLQAVEAAETAMSELVLTHLAQSGKRLDLFAGSGSFALRLAASAQVHAVEADAAALEALEDGWRRASGLKRVTTERRDLLRRPLTARQLDAYDGLVFDPPRAGAQDQATQIARSNVPRVAAVSCNPATLARDLAILVGGGYTLTSVTPLDQFLWSSHVEVVALLERPLKRRRRPLLG